MTTNSGLSVGGSTFGCDPKRPGPTPGGRIFGLWLWSWSTTLELAVGLRLTWSWEIGFETDLVLGNWL